MAAPARIADRARSARLQGRRSSALARSAAQCAVGGWAAGYCTEYGIPVCEVSGGTGGIHLERPHIVRCPASRRGTAQCAVSWRGHTAQCAVSRIPERRFILERFLSNIVYTNFMPNTGFVPSSRATFALIVVTGLPATWPFPQVAPVFGVFLFWNLRAGLFFLLRFMLHGFPEEGFRINVLFGGFANNMSFLARHVLFFDRPAPGGCRGVTLTF